MSLVLPYDAEALRQQFLSLRSARDVADALDVDKSRLNYHLFIAAPASKYKSFEIAKRSGGKRKICAPVSPLKIIQQKLNQLLKAAYVAKPSVNGFVVGRSIVSNAAPHAKNKYVLNVDLKDFFPSINFGRVRGMFMAVPYELNAQVATILAQICCFNNELPQGAPTSPIVSNMICARMDSQLQQLAREHRCYYTRYADDMTFSTPVNTFPSGLATIADDGTVRVGSQLSERIISNGFQINENKVHLRNRHQRQQVTGLTVNRFPNVRRKYVRQVRAMLHAWSRFGLEAATREFFECYDKRERRPSRRQPSFKSIVRGKLEFIRLVKGEQDSVYLNLAMKLKSLAPELVKENLQMTATERQSGALILTEGKTDWKHLELALKKLQEKSQFTTLRVEFDRIEENVGDSKRLTQCEVYAKRKNRTPYIFIFDRDNPLMLKNAMPGEGQFKDWGNNVFSFAIPVPEHRLLTPEISLEFYYTNDELLRVDDMDRRMYMSDEFDAKSHRHKDPDKNLNCTDTNKLKPGLRIIDSGVFNEDYESVTLSKSDFADNVYRQADGFADFSFDPFSKIFEVVKMIIETPRER